MPEVVKYDTPINTTIGCILEFFGVIVNKWAPMFELSIKRDKETRFSFERFQKWMDENHSNFRWDSLYPKDNCSARVKSGKRKGMPCSRKAKKYLQDVLDHVVKLDDEGNPTSEINEIVKNKKGDIINGFCGMHQKLVEELDGKTTKAMFKACYEGEPPTVNMNKDRIRTKNKKILPITEYDNDVGDDDMREMMNKMLSMFGKMNENITMVMKRQDGMRKRLDKVDPSHKQELEDKIYHNNKQHNMELEKEGKIGTQLMSNYNYSIPLELKIKQANNDFIVEEKTVGEKIREKYPDYVPKRSAESKKLDYEQERKLEISNDAKRGELLKNTLVLSDNFVVDGLEDSEMLITEEDIEDEKKKIVDSRFYGGNGKPTKMVKMYENKKPARTASELIDTYVDTHHIEQTDLEFMKKVIHDSKSDKLRCPIMDPSSDPLQKSFVDREVMSIGKTGYVYTYGEMYQIYRTCLDLLKEMRYEYEDNKLDEQQVREYRILQDVMREDILWINTSIGRRPSTLYQLSELVERMNDAIWIFEAKFHLDDTNPLYNYKVNGRTISFGWDWLIQYNKDYN